MAATAARDPAVQDTFAVAGYSIVNGASQSNAGAIFLILKPFDVRAGKPELSGLAAVKRLTAEYAKLREGTALVLPPPPVRGIGNQGGFTFELQDRTGTAPPAELQATALQLMAAAANEPTLQNVFTTFRADVPQLFVEIDRIKAKQQAVAVADAFQTMQVFLGSLYVNDFNFLGRTYRVIAQADAPFRRRAEDVKRLYTRNAAGGMVPIAAIADVRDTVGPDRITRFNLYPAAELNGAAAPGVSTGQALATMERLAADLPQGFGFEWTGIAFQEQQAGGSALFIFPLCVLFVWLTHAAEYESFALSTAIILIVPMCLLFGISGVWLRGMDNNIFTQIGFVVLAGLSAKNAVLIVEFAQQQEHQGKRPFEAAVEASRLRLRPILMTSFAFLLGVLPLLRAQGAGAEMRQALGTAVFFGMLGVTIFGLFLTPVFYYSIRTFTGWFTRRPRREGEAPSEPH
jgi:hydrophobe/amphiphile efflux-1 (HAE1) family protein